MCVCVCVCVCVVRMLARARTYRLGMFYTSLLQDVYHFIVKVNFINLMSNLMFFTMPDCMVLSLLSYFHSLKVTYFSFHYYLLFNR